MSRPKPVPPRRPRRSPTEPPKPKVRCSPLPWQVAAFVSCYRQTFNAAEAAKAAGYAASHAKQIGSLLLQRSDVQELLAKATLDSFSILEVRQTDILRQLLQMAFMDPLDIWDIKTVKGKTVRTVKPIEQIPKHARMCIESLTVVRGNATRGDGEGDDLLTVKTAPRGPALALLMKHQGMLIDRVEHTVTVQALTKLSDEEFDRRDRESRERYEKALEARKRFQLALPPAKAEGE